VGLALLRGSPGVSEKGTEGRSTYEELSILTPPCRVWSEPPLTV